MVSSNMIQLAADAHQAELHRVAADARRLSAHSNGSGDLGSGGAAARSSHRVRRAIARMARRSAARRGATAPVSVSPRISI